MPYRFLKDVTASDVAFEVDAPGVEELFVETGIAVTAVQVENIQDIRDKITRRISLEAENLEELLYKFLDELIFLKDTDLLLFHDFTRMRIEKGEGGGYTLTCSGTGEELDLERHHSVVDVKAVTMHQFFVREENGVWRARVVLDV